MCTSPGVRICSWSVSKLDWNRICHARAISELVSQHTFYRIPFQRTDRLLFIAEKPEVLVRIHIIITNLECQVVGNGNVVYVKRKIIFPSPHCIINGLVLVVQGLLIAGEA